MTPPFRWVGGKSRLLDKLLPHMPSTFNRYHEPFLGGGAVYLALVEAGRVAPSRAILSDINAPLIGLWRAIRDQRLELEKGVAALAELHASDSTATFAGVRKCGPDYAPADMLYLLQTCYQGLWRVNRKGMFNTPIGRNWKGDPLRCRVDAGNLAQVSAALEGASIERRDWRAALELVEAGDLVYVDSPYVPSSESRSFVGYASGGFGEGEHRLLAERLNALRERGAFVVASNNDTPLVRELYQGWNITTAKVAHSVSAASGSRGAVGEVILRGGTWA